jgi:hypothetical protein
MRNAFGFILLIVSVSAQSQFSRGFTFRGKAESITFNKLSPSMIYGVEVNFFLSEKFSLDYGVSLGENYAHMPLSFPIARVIAAIQNGEDDLDLENEQDEIEVDTSESSMKFGFLLALLIPEGFSGHFNLGKRTYFSPSIKPLSVDFIGKDKYEDGESQAWYLANDCGIEIEHFVGKKCFISVFGKLRNTFLKAGVNLRKNEFRYGYSFGFKLGSKLRRLRD